MKGELMLELWTKQKEIECFSETRKFAFTCLITLGVTITGFTTARQTGGMISSYLQIHGPAQLKRQRS